MTDANDIQRIVESVSSLKGRYDELRRAIEDVRKEMPDKQRCYEHSEELKGLAREVRTVASIAIPRGEKDRIDDRIDRVEERVRKVEMSQTRVAVWVTAIVFVIQTAAVVAIGIIVSRAMGGH